MSKLIYIHPTPPPENNMPKSITPIGPRILLKRCEAKVKEGLIHIPDHAQEKSQEALVILLGRGKTEDGKDIADNFTVKPGDRVLIARYAGTDVKLDDPGEFTIVNECDVIGVID